MTPWLYNPADKTALRVNHSQPWISYLKDFFLVRINPFFEHMLYRFSLSVICLGVSELWKDISWSINSAACRRTNETYDDMLLRPVFKGIGLSSDCGETDFFSDTCINQADEGSLFWLCVWFHLCSKAWEHGLWQACCKCRGPVLGEAPWMEAPGGQEEWDLSLARGSHVEEGDLA